MATCILEPRKLSNIQKKQNTWATISKLYSKRKTRKKEKTRDINKNTQNHSMNSRENRSFMSRKKEI